MCPSSGCVSSSDAELAHGDIGDGPAFAPGVEPKFDVRPELAVLSATIRELRFPDFLGESHEGLSPRRYDPPAKSQ